MGLVLIPTAIINSLHRDLEETAERGEFLTRQLQRGLYQ